MNTEDFLQIVREALEMEGCDISLGDCFREYPAWNSLGCLSLMTSIEEEYNVRMESKTIRACQTLADVFEYIKSHAA